MPVLYSAILCLSAEVDYTSEVRDEAESHTPRLPRRHRTHRLYPVRPRAPRRAPCPRRNPAAAHAAHIGRAAAPYAESAGEE